MTVILLFSQVTGFASIGCQSFNGPNIIAATTTPENNVTDMSMDTSTLEITTGSSVEFTPLVEATVEPSELESTIEPSEIEVTTAPAIVTKSAVMRILFTTDLHGQLGSINYETGEELTEGSLSRAYTVIEEKEKETGVDNTFLFDVGDVLYDYSTDYIYSRDETEIQPIYQAMKNIGYDAITLGNHEFDYGFSYIQEQISGAGLEDICVVSNVENVNTGKSPWKDTMMLERELIAVDGTKVPIKIGIIGETQAKLSGKRYDYTGVLQAKDIVNNTREKAKELKEQGANLVVVLAHTGIGVENPEDYGENVGYALTKIDEVDVILCGHEHKSFPSQKETSKKYYQLPGVDKDTELINGKNLVMASNQGVEVGMVDLEVDLCGAGTEITERTSKLLSITDEIPLHSKINQAYMGDWHRDMMANCSIILDEIVSGVNYNNYFGAWEDCSVMQLVNNAKMDFALEYINTKKTKYKDYPIVGVSNYEEYGFDDAEAYVDIENYFLQSYLPSVQKYKTAIYLYNVKGSQLREWIEWSASAYETSNASDKTIISTQNLTQDLLYEDWENNWANLRIFDGVEYTIDTTKKPRYDIKGNKINDSNRVTKLTINGKEVTDNQQIVVVGNRLDASNALNNQITSQKIYSSTERCQNIVKNYIEKISLNGSLREIRDNNWKLIFGEKKTGIVKTGTDSKRIAEEKKWITKWIGEEEGYQYYLADFSNKENEDTTGPNIIATQLNSEITNNDVQVAVRATDISDVAYIKYAKGKFLASASVWDYGTQVTDGIFTCTENGVYSVLAVDKLGNQSVFYIRINNINKSVLEAPKVDSFSNKKTKITGTAEPGATIYFELENGKIYSTKVKSGGKFSCTIPIQKAGKKIYAYVTDKQGRASARTVVSVKRVGPNSPSINTVNSNSKIVTGKINDTYAIPVLIVEDEVVYVPKEDGISLYTNSGIYDSKYEIVEVDTKIDSDGEFKMVLPRLLEGDFVIQFYTIDTLSRHSKEISEYVTWKVPNKPILENKQITNKKSNVEIYTDENCIVYVKTGGKTYSSKKGSFQTGKNLYYHKISIPKSESGEKVVIYGSNVVGGGKKITLTRKEAVPNKPKLNTVKVKAKKLSGTVHLIGEDLEKTTVAKSNTKVYVEVNGKKYSCKVYNSGKFSVKVKAIKANTKIVYWAENINGVGVKGKLIVK